MVQTDIQQLNTKPDLVLIHHPAKSDADNVVRATLCSGGRMGLSTYSSELYVCVEWVHLLLLPAPELSVAGRLHLLCFGAPALPRCLSSDGIGKRTRARRLMELHIYPPEKNKTKQRFWPTLRTPSSESGALARDGASGQDELDEGDWPLELQPEPDRGHLEGGDDPAVGEPM